MRTPWIPNPDSELDVFAANFAARAAADPPAYGLTPADAAEVSSAAAAFSAAYAAWKSPATATSPNLVVKKQRRRELVAALRRVGALVRADAAVPDSRKIDLGIKPVPRGYTHTPAPQERPAIALTYNNHTGHTLRFVNPASTSNARPRGTVGLLLFRTIADQPVSHPGAAQFVALITRDRVRLEPTRGHAGKKATYFARWAGTRGDLGPWSTPVSASIAA